VLTVTCCRGTASASRSRSGRRRRSRKLPKAPRRHIKTPILEENESSLEAAERRVLTARAASRARDQDRDEDHGQDQGLGQDAATSPEKGDSLEEDSLDGAQPDSGKPSPENGQDDSAGAGDHVDVDEDPNNNALKDEVTVEHVSPESVPLTEAKTPSKTRNPPTSKIVSFGEKPKYVKGDTYMSWYKKKKEEREKERKRKEQL